MRGYQALALMIGSLIISGPVLAGCTSDPNAPVNQSFPIHQMDQFFDSLSAPRPGSFGSLSGPRPGPMDYTREPGYAPAYPPYDPHYE
jgi:hypothetical protein